MLLFCGSYCPSVFILKPGQHLIINKGRLHAFRKLTFDKLSEEDCHSKLRESLKQELNSQNIHRPPLCISVAFDWYVMLFSFIVACVYLQS
jgi:hypothetical protein